MAITKTASNVLGTAASKTNIAGGATATSDAQDVSSVIGLVIHILITYGASIPATDPYIEILTSPDNSNFDTEAYAVAYIRRLANNTLMASISVDNSVKYFKVKVTNGATNAIDVWVSKTVVTT